MVEAKSEVIYLNRRIESKDRVKNNSIKSSTYKNKKSFDYSKEISFGLEEVDDMDSKDVNNILLKYMDGIDKKYDDYKRDMVESEKRIYQNVKDSEERYEKRQQDFEKRLDSRFENIEKTFDKMENKFDTLSSEVKENNKYLRGLTYTIIGLAITTIISIVGIAVTVYLSVK